MSRRNMTAKSTQRYLKRTRTAEWKAALYARLSDENNGMEDDRSLQNQIRYLEEYVEKSSDIVPVDRYVDNGSSGMNFERAEFQRMMEDVRDGKINCIVVKDLSRFGRNHIETGCYLETIFPQLDVRFISINDNFDSMTEGRKDGITMPLKNMLNEMYARDTQRKVLNVLREKERKGERGLNCAPYGYMKSPDCRSRYVPDPKTRGYVAMMFAWAADGASCGVIIAKLERMGAVTPMGRRHELGLYLECKDSGHWNSRTIRQLLRNPVYVGMTVYNRSEKSKGEKTVFRNTHEALIDEETYNSALKKLEERSRKKKEETDALSDFRDEHPNIFKGVFYCAECGRAMLYKRKNVERSQRFAKFVCGSCNHDTKETGVTEQTVYKFVLDTIRNQLKVGLEAEKIKQLFDSEANEKKKHADVLKNQEARTRQKLLKLYEDYAEKVITAEEYIRMRNEYTDKLESIRERVAEDVGERGAALNEKPITLCDESVGTLQLTATSSMEIVASDKPDMAERLLRCGLTEELVDTMVERLEYGINGSISIRFKCEDYAEKLPAVQMNKNAEGV